MGLKQKLPWSAQKFSVTRDEQDRADRVASNLHIIIPGETSMVVWALPILEELTTRVIALEHRLKELTKDMT